MNGTLLVATLALALATVSSARQPPQNPQPDNLTPSTATQSEVLISTLPPAELKKQIAAEKGTIEHKSEVERGGPVAVVVRSTGCMKDVEGHCDITAKVTVYGPDGSVFHETKALDLPPTGRLVVPLKIEASTGTGLYKVVVTIRDLTARRFGVVERQFAVK
jgi:hypothetical protein